MIDKAIVALPGMRKTLMLLALLGLVQALLIVGQAWTLATTVTALWMGEALSTQVFPIVFFLVFFIGQQLVRTVESAVLDPYARKRAKELRKHLLSTLFTRGRALTASSGTGNTTTTVIEGVDQVETYIRLMLPKLTGIVTIPLVLLGVAFALDYISGFIMLVTFPFIILYMKILGMSAKDTAAKQYGEYQRLSNHFVDSLSGLNTLKYFGISKVHAQSIFEVSERFRKATIKMLSKATLSGLVLDLFATLSLAAVAIMLGMRLLDGTLVLFPALTILILVPQFYKPVREFAADYHASLDGTNAFRAINELLTKGGDVSNQASFDSDEHADKATFHHYEKPGQTLLQAEGAEGADAQTLSCSHAASLPSWQAHSRLAFEDVSFSYEATPALAHVSFEVTGFAKVGIVGTSGSGKSTLIELLGGFIAPENGSLALEDQELASLKQAHWQSQLIYIPQDPYIFRASLRENIAFYHPTASDSDVTKAVSVMGLDPLVASLPDGLDTLIGEGERALSGGQAQRIALARAFLDPSRRILLLDEPTAHLDIETEWELKERMLPLFEGKLVFFATHRLHWLGEMDQVIVLDEGCIVDQGATGQIVERYGSFSGLFEKAEGERP